jgi:membrane associated rhomboid family serine protease
MTTQTHRGGAVSRFFRLQPVTAWLITANLAVYAATVAQARSMLGNNASALFEATALYPPLVAVQDEWWRLLTSTFQHFGPMHLLLNMYMLWILGLGIERSIGHLRFLALYMVSALGGSVAVMFYGQNALTAGASGAIFGLMGAYAIVAMSMRLDVKGIGLLLVLNIGVSFLVPGISLAAHLGGLGVGAVAAFALVVLPRRLPDRVGRRGREVASWLGYLLVVVLVVAAAWYAADTMSLGSLLTR